MILRLFSVLALIVVFGGCATLGGNKNSQDQMQIRVTELEKKVEEKDSEIVDLQYQIKDLSSKVSTNGSTEEESDESETSVKAYKVSSSGSSSDIIRVDAAVEDIQRALKNAGNYTGKIDGKLGSGTKQAIVDFQKEHQLSADGVVGKRTWKALKSFLKE